MIYISFRLEFGVDNNRIVISCNILSRFHGVPNQRKKKLRNYNVSSFIFKRISSKQSWEYLISNTMSDKSKVAKILLGEKKEKKNVLRFLTKIFLSDENYAR